MKCKKHPKYKAIRKPRVNCKECINEKTENNSRN